MTRNDTRIIHTDGLEEGIRCAMCTNPMANNRGCDGGCDINESMYKRVLDVIKKNILEQEPIINKPCVSSGACEHDKNKVLDKIRAEIMSKDGLEEALEIIDKYKSESEVKE